MDLSAACKRLLIRSPFYGLFLLGLNKYYGNRCQTACVCRNGINTELCVNEEFWNKLDDETQLAVLCHELGHIIFKHITMSEYFGNKNHFNIAADCNVNSYIPELQKDPWVYPAAYSFPNQQGTKWYYENIPQQENEPQFGNEQSSIGSHETWKDFQDLSDAEKELVENQIDYQAKSVAEQVQKMAGSIPGQFKGYIDSLFIQKPPIFNWRAYFRRLIGNVRSEEIKKTRRKESCRFPGSAGIKKDKKTEIMVAIDTSGSVSDSELQDFFSEINNIYRAGAIIKIVEFDHAIQREYYYEGRWDGSISGRGGTSFYEPIALYSEHRRDFQMLVMFTDGYASIDNLKPQGPVVWVITSDGSKQDYPGKTIYIPKDGK